MYYLNSRYYSPEIGRFINADDTDALINNFDSALDGRNLFAYCNNNPITHWDTTGELIDTLFDIISLISSVGTLIDNPSDATNWLAAGADVASLLIPGVTGGGTAVKAVKAIDKGEDVIDNFKAAYNTADKVNGVKKMTGSYTIYYASGNVYDGKGGVKRAVSSAKRPRQIKGSIERGIDEVIGIT